MRKTGFPVYLKHQCSGGDTGGWVRLAAGSGRTLLKELRWKVIEKMPDVHQHRHRHGHRDRDRHRHRQAHLHVCLCWRKLTN